MPGKRSNGEGALRKRSSGLWECMITVSYTHLTLPTTERV